MHRHRYLIPLAALALAGAAAADAPAREALTPVSEIQGAGPTSPLTGRTVTTEGIVTGDFQAGAGRHGDLGGFFLQGAPDHDPATSDGVFVFERTTTVDVHPGDRVRVVGEVAEFFGQTELVATAVSVVARAAATPVPQPIALPAEGVLTNEDGRTVADLERYEGMLVSLPQTLSVTDLGNLDRFGELRLAAGGRLYQFTQRAAPAADGYGAHLALAARRSLLLDDGLRVQNPEPIRYPPPALATANSLRLGDTTTGLTGVLAYGRGAGRAGTATWRLHPTVEPAFRRANPRPGRPAPGGTLTVAGFNVLNYFTTIDAPGAACFPSGTRDDCRGADSPLEHARQRARLITAIAGLDADVIALTELENGPALAPASAVADLAGGLSEARAGGCADWRPARPNALTGDDAIAVGLIYCAATVGLAPGSAPAVLTDAGLPALGLEGPVFDGPETSRAPLAASFVDLAGGGVVTVAVSHLKSKGPGDLAAACAGLPRPAAEPDCDQGDGQGYWNRRRVRAAEATAAWLATDPTGSGDPDVLLVGDFNAYRREDPIAALLARGFVHLGPGPEGYSFVFDGQAGALDHALASRSLAPQVTGVAEWHINADEPDALDYQLEYGRNPGLFDGDLPYRASDHDPLLIGLKLAPARGPATP